jgi:integrase
MAKSHLKLVTPREPGIALRLRKRARIPIYDRGLCPDDRAHRRQCRAGLKAHPHMLRHACGYALANKGHDTRAIQGWLGHRSITSTAVYTALAPNRFKDFWRG